MPVRSRRLIPAVVAVFLVAVLALQLSAGRPPSAAPSEPVAPASTSVAAASTPAAETEGDSGGTTTADGGQQVDAPGSEPGGIATQPAPRPYDGKSRPVVLRQPAELVLRAAHSKVFDVRKLPKGQIIRLERPEVEPPRDSGEVSGSVTSTDPDSATPTAVDPGSMVRIAPRNAPAPPPTNSFDGLDFATWGSGHPPDTNGDVGPTYYIETVNSSIGIYDKTTGTRVAAFTFNSFMSQGSFGNLCDTNNFGDPVVLYDTFENRWVITDFAFKLDGSGNVVNPPGSFQCFAVSKTGDPVSGGWNYYSVNTTGGLGDYPKFGIWPDGIYWSVNMFNYASGGSFENPRVYVMNKSQMYAGQPSVQVLSFDAPSADFTLLPSNARLQTGTPPPGTPDYFVSSWQFLNALSIYAFHVDWNRVSLSTFSGPFVSTASSSWPNASVPNAPSQGGNSLDVLQIRAMMQNQYSNIGGVESLWAAHTVRRANTTGFAAPRYYQVNVTGGSVAAGLPQAATWDPDGANLLYRFMPSVAVDRVGDMALGYSTSSSTTKPAIMYAGRLATDPVNTFSQTEQLLMQGTGTQVGNCGSSACIRWGDYSAMTLDPDGCTFWYANEYYSADGLNDLTRIGSFSYPSCTPVGSGGTLSGTVTASGSGSPISGAAVALGSRTATTAPDGTYAFAGLPAGTYPSMAVSAPGRNGATAASLVVSDSATTTKDFALDAAPAIGNFIDTTQSDFQSGIGTAVDLTTSPGDVTLGHTPVAVQNTTLSNSGVGITITTWGGQTFTPAVTGPLLSADVNLFCSGCTGTTPNLTLSLRATSSNLPTGADLATATITGVSNSGAADYYSATFASPATVTAGTTYALVIRPTANPSVGIYALTRSSNDVYAGGTRVSGATSGTVWSIPLSSGATTDAGFHAFIDAGYQSSGTFVSSVKDANPVSGATATWGNLSWTADVPTGATLTFQAAGSSSAIGPFSFVGPDGASGTTFGNGDSLAQFDGDRYLEYRASLGTSDGASTPTIHDVTIAFEDAATATALAVDPATGTYGGTTTLSATLTSASVGVSGKTVTFTLNGGSVGTDTTDVNGVATLSGVSLAGIDAGSYPAAVGASFGGDPSYASSSGSASLTIDKATATVHLTDLSQTYDGTAKAATSSTTPGGLTVNISYSQGGNPVASPTNAGDYDVSATVDDIDYQGSVTDVLTITKATATLTIDPGSLGQTYDGNPKPVTVTSAPPGLAGISVTYDGGSTVPSAVGSYAVEATLDNPNYQADPATGTLAISKLGATINFAALSNRTFGDPAFAVSATASSGLSVSFSVGASDQCTISGTTVTITGAGSCTVTASQPGDDNHDAAVPVSRTFAIARATSSLAASAVAIAPNPALQFGDTVTLRASFASAAVGGHVKGSVIFRFNGSPGGGVSVPVDGLAPVTASAQLRLTAAIIPIGADAYRVTAQFVPSAGSDYSGSSGARRMSVLPEGVGPAGTLDGSAYLTSTGATSVRRGIQPVLSVSLFQSQGSESADTEFVNFTGGGVKVIFRLYRTNCSTACPTGPIFTSSVIRVVNASTWATTGNGMASVKAPKNLKPGTYLVTVTRVSNHYLLARTAHATVTITP